MTVQAQHGTGHACSSDHTPDVPSERAAEDFAQAAEAAGVSLLASVMLLKSVAMVRYLNNLPGVPAIPHEFLKQMLDAPVKQRAGLEIASSFIGDLTSRCQGAVLIALGWGNRLPEFLDLLGR